MRFWKLACVLALLLLLSYPAFTADQISSERITLVRASIVTVQGETWRVRASELATAENPWPGADGFAYRAVGKDTWQVRFWILRYEEVKSPSVYRVEATFKNTIRAPGQETMAFALLTLPPGRVHFLQGECLIHLPQINSDSPICRLEVRFIPPEPGLRTRTIPLTEQSITWADYAKLPLAERERMIALFPR